MENTGQESFNEKEVQRRWIPTKVRDQNVFIVLLLDFVLGGCSHGSLPVCSAVLHPDRTASLLDRKESVINSLKQRKLSAKAGVP